jgi:glycosyltransferase involved in cell wall biosynthesis
MRDLHQPRRPGVVMLLANLEGSIGGAQRQAGLLACEVAQRGLGVVVVNQSPRALRVRRWLSEDGVHRIALPGPGWFSRSWLLFSFLLWATMNRRKFDVIHAHSTAAGLTAGLVGRLLGKRVLVKVTGMPAAEALADRHPSWRVRRWLLDRTAHAMVGVSNEMMRVLAQAGVRDDRRVLIPNGVRLPDAGSLTPDRPSDPADHGVVLYVGRLAEVKGVGALLHMWSEMPRRQAATLLIVGEGPLRPELERETAARGLTGSVRFLGYRRDVTALYRRADVFVLPSVSEGLSNALLEAMAAGLPAVASDVGGNREVIEQGVSGFLIDWTEGGTAAGMVGRLLEDRALRRRIGEAARRRAASFSIATVADQYCALYHGVAR